MYRATGLLVYYDEQGRVSKVKYSSTNYYLRAYICNNILRVHPTWLHQLEKIKVTSKLRYRIMQGYRGI
jgi:DNA topoisomerase IB